MKKGLKQPIRLVGLFVALGASLSLMPNAFAGPVASVEQIQGEVMINKAGSAMDLWPPVAENTPIESGDSVKTQSGSCVLIYTDQAVIRLDANTSVTAREEADTQDIVLILGNLKAQIDKQKVTKPFQVVTPTAVGAIRGTDVDFGFNDQGLLTVDLKNGGPVQVFNDEAQMNLNLTDGKKISVSYNREKGLIRIKNDCSSNGKVEFNVLGTEYAANPCEEKEINLETAEGQTATPNTNTGNSGENEPNEDGNPDDIPQPVSPTQ